MSNDLTSHTKVSHAEAMLPRTFQRNRRVTDGFFSYVFGLFLITFIGISTYVCVDYDEISFERLKFFLNVIIYASPDSTTDSSILATFIYLLFFVFFITLLRWAPKVLIFLASIMLYIYIILVVIFYSFFAIIIIYIGLEPSLDRLKINLNYSYIDIVRFYVVPALSLIILIPTAICLKKERVKAVSEILKTSCSALACFRSAGHFIVFILFYCVAVIVGILWLVFELSIHLQGNLSSILSYACFLGGHYVYSFLYHFGVAVMSNTIASWHYSQDNEEIPRKSVCRSIKIVCRFHLGTVAFAATMILPFFLAIYAACRHTIKRCANPMIARIFKLVLIGEITNFSLIQTSVHGYNFGESTKRSFDLMVKNYSISIVIIKVFEFVVTIIVNLPIIFSVLLIAACGYSDRKIEASMVYSYGMIMTQMLAPPVFMIVGTAVKTTLIYRLEKQEIAEKSTEMSTFIRVPQNGNVV